MYLQIVKNFMKPLRLSNLLLCIMIVGFPMVVQAVDFEALKSGVVKVVSTFENGKRKIGTGFVIRHTNNEAYIITASHVVEDADAPRPKMTVTFYPDKLRTIPAEIQNIQSIDQNQGGLAVLRVAGELPRGVVALTWGRSDSLKGGEVVDFIGFPRDAGTPWAITKGHVSGWKDDSLTLSGTIGEGNSGGPIFLNGEVVGVVMESLRDFSYGVPASRAGLLAKNWGILDQWPPVEQKDSHVVSPRPSGRPGMASLTIQSTPADAQVFVDDQIMGTTANGSLTLNNMEPDEYDIVVRKDGFAPWAESIEVYPGESRSLIAVLQEGHALDITGTWHIPSNPTLSYIFEQTGEQVVMKVITTTLYGSSVTAEGAGQLIGNLLNIFYATNENTTGRSQAVVSNDGMSMEGSYQDFSNGVIYSIMLNKATPIVDIPRNPAQPNPLNSLP